MRTLRNWPKCGKRPYEESEKVLFSADGFGKFGALSTDEDWTCEARRYYFNIVGKYGFQVQALLKKASALDIQMTTVPHVQTTWECTPVTWHKTVFTAISL